MTGKPFASPTADHLETVGLPSFFHSSVGVGPASPAVSVDPESRMMDETSFDEVLRDLPRNFNDLPEPPLDEMWSVIEDSHFNPRASDSRPDGAANFKH